MWFILSVRSSAALLRFHATRSLRGQKVQELEVRWVGGCRGVVAWDHFVDHRHVVTEVAHGDVVERRGWKVQVAEVVHVQPQLRCLAYRLEAESRSIVFGGDTAPVAALTELARGADVLLHMCHFVNGAIEDPRLTECCSGHLDAARTAQAAGVGTLVLVHITESVERPGVRERVIHEAGAVFSGSIVFAEDLLQVPLDGIEIERIR